MAEIQVSSWSYFYAKFITSVFTVRLFSSSARKEYLTCEVSYLAVTILSSQLF
jgi:hypothetical protein